LRQQQQSFTLLPGEINLISFDAHHISKRCIFAKSLENKHASKK